MSEQSRNCVIYHANCFDGFGAAWIAKNELGPDTKFYPMKYGDPSPELTENDNVYMLDFSMTRPQMEVINTLVKSFKVLDHHKTAQANCEGLDFCTFDMNRSGAGLTWDYFYPNEPRPALISYVEDRDLWRWALPHSRTVSAWISSYPMDFGVWDTLAHIMVVNPNTPITEGSAILRFQDQKVEEIFKEAMVVDLGDGLIPAINCPYNFGSLVGEALCKQYPKAPYAAYYFDRADGEQQWGLRSTGYDVSEVAKRFGGGGHKQAAGFVKGKVTR